MAEQAIPTACLVLLYRLSTQDGVSSESVGQQRPCTVIRQVFEDGELTGFEVNVILSMEDSLDGAMFLGKIVKLGDYPGEIAWPPRT